MEHLESLASFLAERGILLFEFLQVDSSLIHMTFTIHATLLVLNIVPRAVWPFINTVSMFLTIFPMTLKFLAIGVINLAGALAFIVFEITFVNLPIWPHIGSHAHLFTLMEVSIEQTTIWPLE